MRTLTLHDDIQRADVIVHVLDGSPERPLVVCSHGTGSTPFAVKALGEHLAGAGYTVALVEHPGNKRGDDALANTIANLVNRPRHLRIAIDGVLGDREGAVVTIGHSLGGYTALALAGGTPIALPEQTGTGQAAPLTVEHDDRVKAAVLLAPALPWFMAPGALAGVTVPVLVRVGERDELTPPYFVEQIVKPLMNLDYAVVSGAGHFAFFWPILPHLAAARLPPALDPPGFDREAYQPRLYAEVEAFLTSSMERSPARAFPRR